MLAKNLTPRSSKTAKRTFEIIKKTEKNNLKKLNRSKTKTTTATPSSYMFELIHTSHPTLDLQYPSLTIRSSAGKRYVFGKMGEGLQRVFAENHYKLNQLQSFYLTGEMNWESIGGLPGVILTAADQGKTDLNIIYPSKIVNYLISSWRYFIFRFGMSIKTFDECKPQREENFTVTPIVVELVDDLENPSASSTISPSKITEQDNSRLKRLVSKMFPVTDKAKGMKDPSMDTNFNVELPQTATLHKQTVCYEIKFDQIRGRFDAAKAKELNIPNGKIRAEIARGKEVTLESGTIVKPEQVMGPTRSYLDVLVVDIPSNDYIPKLIEAFKNSDLNKIGFVYYFLDESVLINQELCDFMNLFNREHINHYVSHSKICTNDLTYIGAALSTIKLKLINKEVYNLPIENRVYSQDFYTTFNKKLPEFDEDSTLVQENETLPLKTLLPSDNVHVFQQKDTILLEPYIRDLETPKFAFSKASRETRRLNKLFTGLYPLLPSALRGKTPENFKDALGSEILKNNFNTKGKEKDVEIITFGTGSALPGKYRNVISTLIKVPYVDETTGQIENRNVLLDAGENTLGFIHRHFNSYDVKKMFKDLKMIYLSHLHADHHLGIISLLKEWYKHNKDDPEARIWFVTPWQYNRFIREWVGVENKDILNKMKYISCEHLIDWRFVRKESLPNSFESLDDAPATKKIKLDDQSSYRDWDTINELCESLKIAEFKTCKAIHCDWAYSSAITFRKSNVPEDVFKVAYSGDTRPNLKQFALKTGYKSDLLIHEATFEDILQQDAYDKRHSTISEVISVANQMKAKKVLFTHFSQRYPHLPNLKAIESNLDGEYCFAFDGTIINWNNFNHQSKTKDVLLRGFLPEESELENLFSESSDQEETP